MDEKIRVLHVLGGMGRGGAETLVMNLYRNIDRTKLQFDFIVHTDKKCSYDDEIIKLGGKIFRVPKYRGKNHYQYKKAWHTFFQTHPEYRIIHGHVRSTASIYLSIAKKYELTTIAHSHNTSSGKGFSAIVKNILQFPIRNIADYLFTCSNLAGKWLYGKKVTTKSNYKLLKNAIDTEKYLWNSRTRDRIRCALNISSDKFVVGHVGRFHPQKNHEFLIQIFKEIRKVKNNAILLLVGDGELREFVEKKIEEYNLSDSVIITGVRTDVPDLLQAMDVFLFPSLHEGLPVTIIEAQASGLPCVISDTITPEVVITDLVKMVNLNESSTFWRDITIDAAKNKRENMYLKILSAGYDIKSVAKKYQDFCLDEWDKCFD